MPAPTRRFAGLLALGGLFLLLAIVVAAEGNREAARDGTAALRRAQADAALRGGVSRLEAFLFELDRFVLEAEPVGGAAPAAGAPTGGSPTIVAALRGALGASTAPALASASVYQDIDKDEVEVPFERLGTAAADGAPPLAAIPEDVLWDELDHADATGGSTSLVWFSPEEGGGVRLHLAGTAMHEDTVAQKARLRLMHVSMPFDGPSDVTLDVRCDIAAGVRAPALPLHRVHHGSTDHDDTTDAIRPLDMPRMRWPVKDDDRPRAIAHFESYGTSWIVVVLALLGVASLIVAGRWRAPTAPGEEPTDSSPDGPSTTEPEGP